MKYADARFLSGLLIAVLAVAVTLTAAAAQSGPMGGMGGMGGGGGGLGGRNHQGQQSDDKKAAQKPAVDEKAYAAALKALPNKKYDPWGGMR